MDVRYYNGRQISCIIHRNSLRTYPTHSHVFTYTASLLLKGVINITVDNVPALYKAGDTFSVSPYTGHSITPVTPYSMICMSVHKNSLNDKRSIRDCLFFAGVETEHAATLMNILDNIGFRDKYIPPVVALVLEGICKSGVKFANIGSRYHFIREFKRAVGVPPHRLHIQRRVRTAQRLLEKGGLDSAEIASACVFFDQSHFIRHFKKYTCLTPDEYRLACVSLTQA